MRAKRKDYISSDDEESFSNNKLEKGVVDPDSSAMNSFSLLSGLEHAGTLPLRIEGVDTNLKWKHQNKKKNGVPDYVKLGEDNDRALLKLAAFLLEFLIERGLVSVREDVKTGQNTKRHAACEKKM